MSYADSLDCVGVFGSNVEKVERVFDVVNKYDSKDPTAARPEIRERAARLNEDHLLQLQSLTSLEGLRIGIPQVCASYLIYRWKFANLPSQEYFPAELHEEMHKPVRDMLQKLKSLNATLVPVSLPSTTYALSAYYVISSAEASSNMARYDGIQYGKWIYAQHGVVYEAGLPFGVVQACALNRL